MDNNEDLKQKSLDELYKRAGAFEDMVNTEGWKHVKAFYLNNLASFTNDLFGKENEPIENFEGRRRELIGLKKLLSEIDSDLTELDRLRKEKENVDSKE